MSIRTEEDPYPSSKKGKFLLPLPFYYNQVLNGNMISHIGGNSMESLLYSQVEAFHLTKTSSLTEHNKVMIKPLLVSH
jgi:hypothetical protein